MWIVNLILGIVTLFLALQNEGPDWLTWLLAISAGVNLGSVVLHLIYI